VDVCPKRVLVIQEVGKKPHLTNIIDCTICQDCVGVCPQNPPAVQVSWDKDVFVFDIESTGALPVERILLEGLKILDGKTESFLNQLSVKKNEKDQVD
jgi:formate hydrogenlyase subunit 6/NADH:ubiquinone oxidoreductase subunit I